jgi:hypothetical protein
MSSASCYSSCGEGAPETLLAMMRTAFTWQTRLAARGTPLDGDVRLAVRRSEPTAGETEWRGATSITAAIGPSASGGIVNVTDPADMVTLRMLRASLGSSSLARVLLREGDTSYAAVVLDVMPHSNADGRLLPPFPIMAHVP